MPAIAADCEPGTGHHQIWIYPLLAILVFLAVKDEVYSVTSVEDGKEKDTKMAAPSGLH